MSYEFVTKFSPTQPGLIYKMSTLNYLRGENAWASWAWSSQEDEKILTIPKLLTNIMNKKSRQFSESFGLHSQDTQN